MIFSTSMFGITNMILLSQPREDAIVIVPVASFSTLLVHLSGSSMTQRRNPTISVLHHKLEACD
jgi:hypothetical protein